jgi:hypothetical protein
MRVDGMSTTNVDGQVDSRFFWEWAISRAEQLRSDIKGQKRRAALERAIEWFRYRLRTGAPFPGIEERDRS